MANYMDSEARAEDNRSSAWTLLIVGGVGLVVLVLGFLGIIPLPIGGSTKFMFYGVLGVLFIVFFISGIISFKKVKVYKTAASTEKSNKQQIIDWLKENEFAEKITDAATKETDELPEEELYFKRFDMLKMVVFRQFQDMGLQFLDGIMDELYDTLFED